MAVLLKQAFEPNLLTLQIQDMEGEEVNTQSKLLELLKIAEFQLNWQFFWQSDTKWLTSTYVWLPDAYLGIQILIHSKLNINTWPLLVQQKGMSPAPIRYDGYSRCLLPCNNVDQADKSKKQK